MSQGQRHHGPFLLQISSSQPSISTITQAKTAQISHTVTPPRPTFTDEVTPPRPTSVWSFTCLRPAPPLRPSLMCRDDPLRSPRSSRRSTQRKKPGEDSEVGLGFDLFCVAGKKERVLFFFAVDKILKWQADGGHFEVRKCWGPSQPFDGLKSL